MQKASLLDESSGTISDVPSELVDSPEPESSGSSKSSGSGKKEPKSLGSEKKESKPSSSSSSSSSSSKSKPAYSPASPGVEQPPCDLAEDTATAPEGFPPEDVAEFNDVFEEDVVTAYELFGTPSSD